MQLHKPGIAAVVGRREVLAEDHPHTSLSSVTVVNITVKEISYKLLTPYMYILSQTNLYLFSIGLTESSYEFCNPF